MATNIKEIARKLNISAMTVSRALNNKPVVKEQTREKVLKLAHKMGYRPNIIAQSLVKNKSYTVGVIIPDIRHSFFPNITFSIQEVLDKAGYGVILCNSNEDEETEKSLINMLLSRRVDGFIIAPAQNTLDLDKYRNLDRYKIPYIFIDRYLKGLKTPSIVSDDKGGAFKAIEYLIKLGHRRIVFLSGPVRTSTSDDRLKGFKKALKQYKVPFKDDLILECGFDRPDGYKAAGELLSRKEKPTAIFVVNDIAAMGVYDLLKEKRIKVPQQISVMGFADMEFASVMYPALTTVKQPKEKIGKIAGEYILKMIEKRQKAFGKKILPAELVIRESCRQLKK